MPEKYLFEFHQEDTQVKTKNGSVIQKHLGKHLPRAACNHPTGIK